VIELRSWLGYVCVWEVVSGQPLVKLVEHTTASISSIRFVEREQRILNHQLGYDGQTLGNHHQTPATRADVPAGGRPNKGLRCSHVGRGHPHYDRSVTIPRYVFGVPLQLRLSKFPFGMLLPRMHANGSKVNATDGLFELRGRLTSGYFLARDFAKGSG